MARFTIELPDELGASNGGVDRSRAAVTDQRRTGSEPEPPDPATRRFVSWLGTWAGT